MAGAFVGTSRVAIVIPESWLLYLVIQITKTKVKDLQEDRELDQMTLRAAPGPLAVLSTAVA
jgi:hypothetical protein